MLVYNVGTMASVKPAVQLSLNILQLTGKLNHTIFSVKDYFVNIRGCFKKEYIIKINIEIIIS